MKGNIYKTFLVELKYKLTYPFIIIKNWCICKRYPFLFINSGIYPWADRHYADTWIDYLEPGWKKAFGWKMIRELDQYLRKNKIKDYHIDQVKEKWGELCWYDNNIDVQHNVIDKYIELSKNVCVVCGRPAKYRSTGWILYYCDKCINPDRKYIKL